MSTVIYLQHSPRKDKKYLAELVQDGQLVDKVHFGQKSAEDFTMHKDPERKDLYIKRHEKREEQLWRHIPANLRTAAYWSRWLTWEFPSISDSIKFIQQKQDVKINSRI